MSEEGSFFKVRKFIRDHGITMLTEYNSVLVSILLADKNLPTEIEFSDSIDSLFVEMESRQELMNRTDQRSLTYKTAYISWTVLDEYKTTIDKLKSQSFIVLE